MAEKPDLGQTCFETPSDDNFRMKVLLIYRYMYGWLADLLFYVPLNTKGHMETGLSLKSHPIYGLHNQVSIPQHPFHKASCITTTHHRGFLKMYEN